MSEGSQISMVPKIPEWAQTLALRHDSSVEVKKEKNLRQLPPVSKWQSLIMEEFSESKRSLPVPLLK